MTCSVGRTFCGTGQSMFPDPRTGAGTIRPLPGAPHLAAGDWRG